MLLGLTRVRPVAVIRPGVFLSPSFLRNLCFGDLCFELSDCPLVSFAIRSLRVARLTGERVALLLERCDPCVRGVDEDQFMRNSDQPRSQSAKSIGGRPLSSSVSCASTLLSFCSASTRLPMPTAYRSSLWHQKLSTLSAVITNSRRSQPPIAVTISGGKGYPRGLSRSIQGSTCGETPRSRSRVYAKILPSAWEYEMNASSCLIAPPGAHGNVSEPSLQELQTAMSWSSAHVRTMPSNPPLQIGPPIPGVAAPSERDIPFVASRQQQPRNRLQVTPVHPARHSAGPVIGISSQVRRDPRRLPSFRSKLLTFAA